MGSVIIFTKHCRTHPKVWESHQISTERPKVTSPLATINRLHVPNCCMYNVQLMLLNSHIRVKFKDTVHMCGHTVIIVGTHYTESTRQPFGVGPARLHSTTFVHMSTQHCVLMHVRKHCRGSSLMRHVLLVHTGLLPSWETRACPEGVGSYHGFSMCTET